MEEKGKIISEHKLKGSQGKVDSRKFNNMHLKMQKNKTKKEVKGIRKKLVT